MRTDLRGLWVPLITPLTTDDEVDVMSLERLAERLLGDGVTGLVALGTTGEPATLTSAERRQVIEVCADVCERNSRPLIVGVGSNSTRSTVEDINVVASLVAPSALLVVVPYYTRPSEEGVVEHFRIVAAESPAPIVVYNIPYRTGRGLGAEALLEIASLPNVAGLKQAVGSLDYDTLELLRCRPPSFHVLAGDDAYIAPSILMGASGSIVAAAHVCTAQFVEMVEAALGGQANRARSIAASLLPVVNAGFAEPNPAVWKAALHAAGEIANPSLRAPMTAASASASVAIVEAINLASAESSRPDLVQPEPKSDSSTSLPLANAPAT